jgi:cyanophycin synthetase
LNEQSLVQLGYGIHQQRIQATVTNRTNMISVDIASNKAATKKLLGEMGVPVPKGFRITAKTKLKALSIIRVSRRHQTARRQSRQRRDRRHRNSRRGAAPRFSSRGTVEIEWVVVEKMIAGEDFRALVVEQ